MGGAHATLQDFCFDLKSSTGSNIFVDINNATCTGETVFKKENKERVQETIANWIKNHLRIQITWNNDHQYDATTYRLDPKARNLASQLTAIANETLQSKTPLKTPPSQQKPAPSSMPAITHGLIWQKSRKHQPMHKRTITPSSFL